VSQDEYRKYLRSNYWRQFAAERKEKRHYRCQHCDEVLPPWELEVHHKTYERMPYREWASDVLVLCRDCHQAEHDHLSKQERIDRKLEEYLK
jgi:5-methylcytosine-specific restriction endonuclease McrA